RGRTNLHVCSDAVHCFGIVIYNENTNSKLRVARGGVEDQRLNGLLRKREPLRPYRQGWSTALVSPIRGPTSTSMSWSRAKISNGGWSSASPYCASVMPSAWQSRPGPAHNSPSSV